MLNYILGTLHSWHIARLIKHGGTIGHYIVVPPGYTGKVMHTMPQDAADPLDQHEIIAWKLRPIR